MIRTTRLSTIGTLVVDDSKDECDLLSTQLRRIPSVRVVGYIHSGMEALAYLRGVDPFTDRTKFPYPELMLLDFNMPECTGMEVLDLLRREVYRPRVVLWSNAVDQIDATAALKLGADLVCAKPVYREELADLVQRLEENIFKRITPFVSWREARHEADGVLNGTRCQKENT